MKEFRIGSRSIGRNYPPFIIAEVGINHEGSVDKAKQCIDEAVKSGADCIKFQCHITDAEMIPTDMKPGKISDEKLWDIIKRCELTETDERNLKRYCEEKGILYLSTPFSKEAADRLQSMNVAAFKIGSGECNNVPLLEHVARMGKPIILSTGMNDMESIRKSVEAILKCNQYLMLMHCTSMYPTPYEKVRLGAVQELENAFGLPVGLSDHSLGIYASLGAVALGACAIEKHFTVSRKWKGPDISISIQPDELNDLVKGSKAIFAAVGGKKEILPEERPVIDFAYASVVTIAPIKKGEYFTKDNTWVKRPAGPILANDLGKVLNRRAAQDLPMNHQVDMSDVEES